MAARSPRFELALLRLRRNWPVMLTWALVITVASLIASTFVGEAHSPYGACYGHNGRPIPCAAIESRP